MSGIIINVLAVVIGGFTGALFGKKISSDFTEKLNSIFGICSFGMGIYSILQMKNMCPVVLAVILGTCIGLLIHLGYGINKGGLLLQKAVSKILKTEAAEKDEQEQLAYNSLLLTAIVIFCSSGTGIYGCLDAGMTGDCTILFSKSILDVFTAFIFACTLGYVTVLIALPQLLLFVMWFFLAKLIVPLTTPDMICDFKACGGFLLLATGFRVSKIKDFPLADMIPAMFIVMPLSWIWASFIVPVL